MGISRGGGGIIQGRLNSSCAAESELLGLFDPSVLHLPTRHQVSLCECCCLQPRRHVLFAPTSGVCTGYSLRAQLCKSVCSRPTRGQSVIVACHALRFVLNCISLYACCVLPPHTWAICHYGMQIGILCTFFAVNAVRMNL